MILVVVAKDIRVGATWDGSDAPSGLETIIALSCRGVSKHKNEIIDVTQIAGEVFSDTVVWSSWSSGGENVPIFA